MLGMGGSGMVYDLFDHNLARPIAVKVLNTDQDDAAEHIASFIDEARLTARLDQPNVLPIYEIAVTDGGQPFFTMKQVDGRTLGDALKDAEQGLPAPLIDDSNKIVSILISVCQAVSYAHHLGIVHQDIKPDNIMLGRFGEVLLLDWGSATVLDGSGRYALYATPLYMSPEQARREAPSLASDIYCLGATLFHVLTLRLPTWSDEPERFWAMKRAGEVRAPTAAELRRIPAPLLAIAMKAISPPVQGRYASVVELLDDLKRYQAGLAVSAYRDSAARALMRLYRQYRWQIWSICACLVVLAGSGLLLLREWQKQQASWHLVLDEEFDHGLGAVGQDWQAFVKYNYPETAAFSEVPLTDPAYFAIADGHLSISNNLHFVDLTCRRRLPGAMARRMRAW